MCSVDSCYEQITQGGGGSLVGSLCRKCNEKSAKIVLQRKFPYCRECFLLYVSHKYNGGLGKSKLLKNGDKVLVAFSGSPYSICLIDLIFLSLVEDRKKKTRFDVEIVFIDERCRVSNEERFELFKSIKSLLSGYEYNFYYTTLFPNGEDVLLLKDLDVDSVAYCEIDISLSGINSNTSHQDLTLQLRNDVLFRSAKKLGCNKIFTAETSDHVASSILSNLALGRGKQLSSITGMTDKRNDILLIRPLRECSKKEMVFYNVFNKLNYYNINWNLEKDKFSSIQKLSEHFVTELQQTFPSTVSTVVSTGNKLFLNCNNISSTCVLCQSCLDVEVTQLTALDALRISNLVSNLRSEALVDNYDEMRNSFESYGEEKCHSSDKSLSHLLCHSCREIMKDSVSMELDWLKRRLFQIHTIRQRMHSEIQDFLLKEDCLDQH